MMTENTIVSSRSPIPLPLFAQLELYVKPGIPVRREKPLVPIRPTGVRTLALTPELLTVIVAPLAILIDRRYRNGMQCYI